VYNEKLVERREAYIGLDFIDLWDKETKREFESKEKVKGELQL
jgi:hypothetical protein